MNSYLISFYAPPAHHKPGIYGIEIVISAKTPSGAESRLGELLQAHGRVLGEVYSINRVKKPVDKDGLEFYLENSYE